MNMETDARVALVTGGTAGLGLALARALAEDGWRVVTDGRSEERIAAAGLPEGVTVVPGDVTDADHRAALVAAVGEAGRLDLLVLNASTLGPLPMRPLAEATIPDLQQVWRTNIGAPAGPHRRAAALAARGRRRDPLAQLRRGGPALRDLGPVRRQQGGARPPRAHLRRGDRAVGVRRGPRRHAHPDAPGRLPGRGHLRPAAARRRWCRACSRLLEQRPASGRYRADEIEVDL